MLVTTKDLYPTSSDNNLHNDPLQLTSKIPSLEDIADRLPPELILTILKFACFLPPLTDSAVSGGARPPSGHPYDHETSLSLLTSSRELNALVRPILYDRVEILRPSSLASLHRALLVHSSLRRWIKRLVVGTKNGELRAEEWWPLQIDYDAQRPLWRGRWITNGLQDHEQDRLPQRFKPGQRMYLDEDDRAAVAVSTIPDAETLANIDLQLPWRAGEISSDLYIVRLFWVQAAVDLRLIRERQDQDKLANALTQSCRTSCSTLCTTPNPFEQFRAHLFRRGAPADSFDHPLVFARSKLQRYFIDDMMRPKLQANGPYPFLWPGFKSSSLDPTCFRGHVGLTRAAMNLLSKDCRVEIHPAVLAESVNLDWERGLSRTEEKGLDVVFAPEWQLG